MGKCLEFSLKVKDVKTGKVSIRKKGVAFFGLKTGAPVLPVAIICLDAKKWIRKPVKVVIGPMIYLNEFKSSDYTVLAEAVMKLMMVLQQSKKVSLP
jgi:1-acyl-sn-glycerol-3-phosphate acyltransferase